MICAVVGNVTGTGRVILRESDDDTTEVHPVDLPLNQVLKDMPAKEFALQSRTTRHAPLALDQVDLESALQRVLRLPSVASKR